jgi:hypothetical protein
VPILEGAEHGTIVPVPNNRMTKPPLLLSDPLPIMQGTYIMNGPARCNLQGFVAVSMLVSASAVYLLMWASSSLSTLLSTSTNLVYTLKSR